ncbi:MAG: hypothetical protein ABUL47_01220, partial [Leifsonia sp.]
MRDSASVQSLKRGDDRSEQRHRFAGVEARAEPQQLGEVTPRQPLEDEPDGRLVGICVQKIDHVLASCAFESRALVQRGRAPG